MQLRGTRLELILQLGSGAERVLASVWDARAFEADHQGHIPGPGHSILYTLCTDPP